MAKDLPSRLEMKILSVLWTHGPSSVRTVMEQIPDTKNRAYTTVLTILQRLEQKGLVNHKKDGSAYIYRATKQMNTILRPIFKDLVNDYFQGSQAEAIRFLLDETKVKPDEMKEVRKVVRDYK